MLLQSELYRHFKDKWTRYYIIRTRTHELSTIPFADKLVLCGWAVVFVITALVMGHAAFAMYYAYGCIMFLTITVTIAKNDFSSDYALPARLIAVSFLFLSLLEK